jgi:hypothetical protein
MVRASGGGATTGRSYGGLLTIFPRRGHFGENRGDGDGVAIVQLVRALAPLVEAIRHRDAPLADQLRRAGSSLLLNLAEGNQRSGRDR